MYAVSVDFGLGAIPVTTGWILAVPSNYMAILSSLLVLTIKGSNYGICNRSI